MTVPVESTPVSDQLEWVRAQEEKTHRQRRLTNWIVIAACLATLGVVGAQYADLSDRLAGLANRAFGKKAVAAQAAGTKKVEDQIILCEENHTNRNLEQINHLKVEPLAKGCPRDRLLPARARTTAVTRTVVVTVPVVRTVTVPATRVTAPAPTTTTTTVPARRKHR